MSHFTLDHTVAHVVLQQPALSRVFESLGIDYCCGGKRTLSEACAKKQIDPDRLLDLLAAPSGTPPDDFDLDLDAMPLGALIENILERHHAYLRTELPRLDAMIEKVTRVHGEKEPRLATMLSTFQGFAGELASHMMKEERILFPAIAQMEQSGGPGVRCFASVAQPIAQMEYEHEDAGRALEALRELSDDYTPPDWACNTYRALLDGLHDLERNMHQHVHKENNALFPRAIRLEEQLRRAARNA